MIDYNFASYKQSIQLKILGFDWDCLGYYVVGQEKNLFYKMNKYNSRPNYKVSAPLYSQAFSWFRSIHGIQYEILPFFQDEKLFGYNFVVYETQKERIEYEIDELSSPIHCDYKTYEEAENACLIRCISLIDEESHEKVSKYL